VTEEQGLTLLRRQTMVKDPVCGMMIDEKTAAGKSDYQGRTYYFCAMICKTKFDQNPQAYSEKDR
jgi:YHS domain-containing protein